MGTFQNKVVIVTGSSSGIGRATAMAFAKQNVLVNAVCPGAIHTPMLERFTKGEEQVMADQDPMGRVGRPEEIADSVLWLCSDKAESLTNGEKDHELHISF